MSNLMMYQAGDKFVGRDEIACVETPDCTDTWHPVPHIDVIQSVDEVVKSHGWNIVNEEFGLAREGKKMFGVYGNQQDEFTRVDPLYQHQ